MANLALFGGIATRAYAAKMMADAEAKLNTVAAGEKPHVIIAWLGAPLDGHAGVVEGVNEQGKSLVRLDATGGVFAVPGQFLVAAPATKAKPKEDKKAEPANKRGEKAAEAATPKSRGDAPQKEDMSKRAKTDKEDMVAPTSLEELKPKDISIDLARTAPKAPASLDAILGEIDSVRTEKEAAEAQIQTLSESLKLDLIDKRFQDLVEKALTTIVQTGEPILKIGDALKEAVAVDVKRDIVEANKSQKTLAAEKKLVARIANLKAAMAKLSKEIKDINEASFARMGGVERMTPRVSKFPLESKLIHVVSQLATLGLTGPAAERLVRLRAGLLDMFKSLWEGTKELLNDLKSAIGEANAYVSSYQRDAAVAKKAEGAEEPKPAEASAPGAGEPAPVTAARKAKSNKGAVAAGQKVKAGIRRLPIGRWQDTNGNSYATIEEAAEAEAYGYVDSKLDENDPEFKAQHAAAVEEILSGFGR